MGPRVALDVLREQAQDARNLVHVLPDVVEQGHAALRVVVAVEQVERMTSHRWVSSSAHRVRHARVVRDGDRGPILKRELRVERGRLAVPVGGQERPELGLGSVPVPSPGTTGGADAHRAGVQTPNRVSIPGRYRLCQIWYHSLSGRVLRACPANGAAS